MSKHFFPFCLPMFQTADCGSMLSLAAGIDKKIVVINQIDFAYFNIFKAVKSMIL